VQINHPELPSAGAGESSIRPRTAALANAIFDTSGVRLRRAALTRERVEPALRRRPCAHTSGADYRTKPEGGTGCDQSPRLADREPEAVAAAHGVNIRKPAGSHVVFEHPAVAEAVSVWIAAMREAGRSHWRYRANAQQVTRPLRVTTFAEPTALICSATDPVYGAIFSAGSKPWKRKPSWNARLPALLGPLVDEVLNLAKIAGGSYRRCERTTHSGQE